MIDLGHLNQAQREAVLAPPGPLLIVAGAGSGKTTVLTTRMAHMVRDLGVDPTSVLAITFTNKAAREMKERLTTLLGAEVQKMRAATFHSALLAILRRHATEIGLRPGFSVFDQDDQRKLVANVTEDAGFDPKVLKVRSTLSLIGQAKSSLTTPAEIARQGRNHYSAAQVQIAAAYQEALRSANALDFDDILVDAVALFRSHPAVLKYYQERFTQVFVDEYQDTNIPQHEVVKALAAIHRNVTVVGDSDQSIYAFRGAKIANILSFDRSFPEARTIVLEQNYRSTPAILDAANKVISHNLERPDKVLFTNRSGGAAIEVLRFRTGADEATSIALEARTLVAKGRRGGDIAVLCRTKAVGRGIEQAMLVTQVPCRFVGAVPFFQRGVIRDLVGYLRLVSNPSDEIAFRRVVNLPRRGIGEVSAAKIRSFARAAREPVGLAIRRSDEIGLPKASEAGLVRLSLLLDQCRDLAAKGRSPGALLARIVEETSFRDHLAKQGDDIATSQVEATETLLDLARRFKDVETFLEQAALSSETDEVDEKGAAVLIMTVHASKGLEFPVVFVPALEEGIFPDLREGGAVLDEGDLDAEQRAELEEERRLAYVAITRAKERLVLSFAAERYRYGMPQYPLPSRFLSELGEAVVDRADLALF
ncbi:MAG: ATP-dependent helicase [Acidimicrobiales bacterium]